MLFFWIITLLMLRKKRNFEERYRRAWIFWGIGFVIDAILLYLLLIDEKQTNTPAFVFLGVDALLLVLLLTRIKEYTKQKKSQKKSDEEEQQQRAKKAREDASLKLYRSCRDHMVAPGVPGYHMQGPGDPGFEENVLVIARSLSLTQDKEEALRLYEEGRKLCIDNNASTALQQQITKDREQVKKEREQLNAELRQNEALARISGKEKYLLLSDALMEDLKESQDSTSSMRSRVNKGPASVNYHEKNWGIAGGIAEGIAGPLAGVAAALGTMKANEKRKASADATNRVLYDSWSLLKDNIKDFEHQDAYASKLIRALRSGVRDLIIDDTKPDEKFAMLNCSAEVLKVGEAFENEGQSLEVRVTVAPAAPLKLLGGNAFMDGALLVNCLKDGEIVGKAYILPKGFAAVTPLRQEEQHSTPHSRSQRSVHFYYDLSQCALCDTYTVKLMSEAGKHLSDQDHYTFTFKPINLWLVEKKLLPACDATSEKSIECAEAAEYMINSFIKERGGKIKAILDQYQKKHPKKSTSRMTRTRC